MERIRKHHNALKFKLIGKYTRPDDLVLDVGCGRGGDLKKWNKYTQNLHMVEPDKDALEEARRRAKGMNMFPQFYCGAIEAAPTKKYDIICYNFSLQYTFESWTLFRSTMAHIRKRSRPGTRVMGCVPDSEFILMNPSFQDTHGNICVRRRGDTGNGKMGERVKVMLAETPYYDGNFIAEPIAHKDLFLTWMENHGFTLLEWSPLNPTRTGEITDLYSKFCFLAS